MHLLIAQPQLNAAVPRRQNFGQVFTWPFYFQPATKAADLRGRGRDFDLRDVATAWASPQFHYAGVATGWIGVGAEAVMMS